MLNNSELKNKILNGIENFKCENCESKIHYGINKNKCNCHRYIIQENSALCIYVIGEYGVIYYDNNVIDFCFYDKNQWKIFPLKTTEFVFFSAQDFIKKAQIYKTYV